MNNSNEHQVSREKAMMDMAEEARQENISRNIRSQEAGTDAGMAPEPFGDPETYAKVKAGAEWYVEMQRSLMAEWLASWDTTFNVEELRLIRSWMAKAVFAGC